MKKLVLMLAVVFSASLFSCGNSDKAAAATDSVATDTVVAAVVEEVVDTANADTTVVAAVAETVDTVAAK